MSPAWLYGPAPGVGIVFGARPAFAYRSSTLSKQHRQDMTIEEQQRLAREILDPQRLARRQRTVVAHHRDQPLVKERRDLQARRIEGRPRKHDVE